MKAFANDDRMSLRGHLCMFDIGEQQKKGLSLKGNEEISHHDFVVLTQVVRYVKFEIREGKKKIVKL